LQAGEGCEEDEEEVEEEEYEISSIFTIGWLHWNDIDSPSHITTLYLNLGVTTHG